MPHWRLRTGSTSSEGLCRRQKNSFELSATLCYPLDRTRRPSWFLSRKAGNAITKLPKAISKPIPPMNIKMISAAVIGAASLSMYSGKPVIGSGGYQPCHGSHEWILPQYDRNFNSTLLSGNESTGLIFECHISATEKIKHQLHHLLWLADFLLPKCYHAFIIVNPHRLAAHFSSLYNTKPIFYYHHAST